VILRCAAAHGNALSPLGERVACDGAFISRRGPGEGVRARYFHGGEGSLQFVVASKIKELRGSFVAIGSSG
jgi:hypothetical protein